MDYYLEYRSWCHFLICRQPLKQKLYLYSRRRRFFKTIGTFVMDFIAISSQIKLGVSFLMNGIVQKAGDNLRKYAIVARRSHIFKTMDWRKTYHLTFYFIYLFIYLFFSWRHFKSLIYRRTII